eukprot:TRINITY_DN3829_c0_g1_i4.p1 TRINITY_DN3829_c0_g1~~TRINITY_DN3829_c0_g1_i4.p1  ORF type:complete len:166 (-),score=42.21 TRINITY_DN3829_c0_g1_i4:41-538(-)
MTGKRSREGRDVEEQSRATALRQRTRSNAPALPIAPATPPIAPTAPAPPPTAPAAAAAQIVDAPAAPAAASTAPSSFARLTARVSAALDRIPTGTACTGVVNFMVHVAAVFSTALCQADSVGRELLACFTADCQRVHQEKTIKKSQSDKKMIETCCVRCSQCCAK